MKIKTYSQLEFVWFQRRDETEREELMKGRNKSSSISRVQVLEQNKSEIEKKNRTTCFCEEWVTIRRWREGGQKWSMEGYEDRMREKDKPVKGGREQKGEQ
ncbi:hypothetical protein BVRB_5g112660 [Beta vulgaris subsp. vulgaris]|uniref:Uncharacterized protein n=1 Tax=Beta vulgaris subsp. vulgaris TaxID=3555 RepID=A0A0J8F522_BETVV|nr:hypothetical protein BVRB_5g112660 [Beta vulgaris subsp. vulgaris]